jgi:peptidoglycan/xylan/chitin deacetylase (PgdA/CDA1 family)
MLKWTETGVAATMPLKEAEVESMDKRPTASTSITHYSSGIERSTQRFGLSRTKLQSKSHTMQKIACLSIDTEPDLGCPQQRIRLLDDDSKLEAFCALLQREEIPLTAFVVMKHARRYADRLNALARMCKVEFAVHSYSHDRAAPASASEIDQSWDEFGAVWNCEPRGYRSPNCLIDGSGLQRLAGRGYQYDSSITPSIRFDRYGYNHIHLPRTPFIVEVPEREILELPIACLRGVPVPFILSYVKLFGLGAYQLAVPFAPLPNVVACYFHPYDLYAAEIAGGIKGWKRYAHLRNSAHAMNLLEGMIKMLKKQGYRFVLMRDLAQGTLASENVPRVPVDAVH